MVFVFFRIFAGEKNIKNKKMTSEEKVHYWLDIAAYDIETAEAMYQTGRWLYVARYPEDKEALSSMLTPQTGEPSHRARPYGR